MFPIKNIMDTTVSYVSPETHVYVAMHLLLKERLPGLPVLDADMHVVGFVSERDFLHILMSGESTDGKYVSDYMVRNVKTFDAADSAVDACEYFMNHPVLMLPIVEDGRYVGVVRRRDIIYLILRIRGKIHVR